MQRPTYFRIGDQRIRFYSNGRLGQLSKVLPGRRLLLITDQNVFNKHRAAFAPFDTIVLRSGERYKVQATVDGLVDRLIKMKADRATVLVGVGGGVVTDLVGYLASIYMRGVDFGLVPTTLLGMVDASIGGKNGVDVEGYKNLVGTIRQPLFLLHDLNFLSTLPDREWSNGFAEIIKHAAIGDARMFRELSQRNVAIYQKDPAKLRRLIARNVAFKFHVVQQDPFEKGLRKCLNFGHTLGHALEMHYQLSHGQAISLGMMFAATLSSQLLSFESTETLRAVLSQYGLPTDARFSADKIFSTLSMDKKRVSTTMDFILLKRLGACQIQPIPVSRLKIFLRTHS